MAGFTETVTFEVKECTSIKIQIIVLTLHTM